MWYSERDILHVGNYFCLKLSSGLQKKLILTGENIDR